MTIQTQQADPRAGGEAHSAAAIAEAALSLIDEEGIGAFSTRRLAERIGLKAMSLYHYFPSRGALLDAVVDRMVGEIPLAQTCRDWRGGLLQLARAYRSMGHRHLSAAPLLAERCHAAPAMARLDDAMSALLHDAGLAPPEAALWLTIQRDYVAGSLSADYAAFLQTKEAAAQSGQSKEKKADAALKMSGAQLAWRNRVFEIGYSALLDAIDRRTKPR